MSVIGQRIKSLRKSLGLTQKDLGLRLGIKQQMVAQYENSENPPKIETIRKIANALGVNITEILSEEAIQFRIESEGYSGIESVLRMLYDTVDIQFITVNEYGETDGDYKVYLRRGNEDHTLSKGEYEILVDWICEDIVSMIDKIERMREEVDSFDYERIRDDL